jgi:hypothetical protein
MTTIVAVLPLTATAIGARRAAAQPTAVGTYLVSLTARTSLKVGACAALGSRRPTASTRRSP